MKKILFAFLLIIFLLPKLALSQQPTQKEMQAQMQEAMNDMRKQIADLEKQIETAKKEDPDSVKDLAQQLAMLKKQLAMMEGLNKNIPQMPTAKTPKPNPFENTDGKRFPARKTALLESLPKRKISKQELITFLTTVNTELKKKLPAESVKETNTIISRLEGDAAKIGLAGAMAWYANAPSDALLLSAYAASKVPDNNTLSNCGAIFNLCGLEDKAIPVLKYVLAQVPTNSTVLNNLGQAYAGLGELDTAMRYLRAAMVQNSSHPEACATSAYIEYERGNTAEAVKLMTEALKTGYSDARAKFIDDINPGRSLPLYGLGDIDLKNKFYMTSDFDLPPNFRKWSDCEDVWEKQQAFGKKIDEMITHYTNLVLQNSMVTITGPTSPWNEAVYYKMKQIGDDYTYRRGQDGEHIFKRMQEITDAANLAIQALDARYKPQYDACVGVGGDCLTKVIFRHCQDRAKEDERWHNELADVAENFQHKWYPQDLDYHNKIVWLMSVRSTDDRFLKAETATQTLHMLQTLKVYALSVVNPAGKPNCEQYNPANPQNQSGAKYIDADCPINIIVPLGALKMNLNCRQFKVDVGQGIVLTYEKDFITKETTIALGPGASLGPGVAEVGVKAQAFVKFDGNNQPVDLGISGEVEVEIAGPISPIIKSGFTVGINSGVNPTGQLTPLVGVANYIWR